VSITTLIFASLTIVFQNTGILIFRDTFHDFFFAAAIFFGLYYKKFFLKRLFCHVIDLTDRGWKVMSYTWGIYFIITGSINELIREYGSTQAWIDFKVSVIFVTLSLVGLLAFYLRNERATSSSLQ
jgi:intracellular septation protein